MIDNGWARKISELEADNKRLREALEKAQKEICDFVCSQRIGDTHCRACIEARAVLKEADDAVGT